MAKTFLEQNFPDVPEDLLEVDGEIFICRDFTGKADCHVVTTLCFGSDPIGENFAPCIHRNKFGRPKPCDICYNLGNTHNGRKLLFHDTGD